MDSKHHLNRQDFVKVVLAFLGTIMGAIIGIPAIGFLITPALRKQEDEAWIPLGPLEKYPLDTPTLFSFTRTRINGWEKTVNSYGVYVVRKSESDLTVFSNLCTHLACRVKWIEDREIYLCPCHDGHFDSDGEVVNGPPPEPLYRYETKVEEGNLFLFFKEG